MHVQSQGAQAVRAWVKISFATGYGLFSLVGTQSIPGSHYDARGLSRALGQVAQFTGQYPERSCLDIGYRGHDASDPESFNAGKSAV